MFSVSPAQNANSSISTAKYTQSDLVAIYGEEAVEFNFDPRTLENLERLVLMHLARGLAIKKISNSTPQTPKDPNLISSIGIGTGLQTTPLLIGALIKSQSPEVGIIMLIDNTILVKKLSINASNYDGDKELKILENIDSFREAKSTVDTEGQVTFGETALRGATPEERKDVLGFLKETLEYLSKVYKDRQKYKVEVGDNFNSSFNQAFK